MLLRTSFCDILCYQILFALIQGKVIVFILFHQTSAHLYAKPQMSDSYLRLWMPVLWRTALQADAWWCVMNPRALPPVTI